MARQLTLNEADVNEDFFERGWTDGLPVVPPTPERVEAALEHAGVKADTVIGTVPERSRQVSAEKAAINAVMAGCEPRHFPVVLAAISAMLDPKFGCHSVVTSTGGASLCVAVSGPMVAELGFNSSRNALGPGHRANATVGRAVRLVAMNVLGARSDSLDSSSLGSPAKYTFVVAEEPPPQGWDPLAVELGYQPDETSVTVLAAEGPHQVANHLNGDPDGVMSTLVAAMTNPATFGVGRRHQVLLVLGYEHRQVLAEAGWSKSQIREFLTEQTRVTPQYLEAGGIVMEHTSQCDMTPEADGKLPTIETPNDILLVTAGSPGAGWSAYVPSWAPVVHSRSCSRMVMAPGLGLPLN